jgi:hypothetical protein
MDDVRITADDTCEDIARKIFYKFDTGQSCMVKGFVTDREELIPKGDIVLDILRKIDSKENMWKEGNRKRRKRKVLSDSIGGYVAQKIFRFKKETVDREYKVTIWRVQ